LVKRLVLSIGIVALLSDIKDFHLISEHLNVVLEFFGLLQVKVLLLGELIHMVLEISVVDTCVGPVILLTHEVEGTNHQVERLEHPGKWLNSVPIKENVDCRTHST